MGKRLALPCVSNPVLFTAISLICSHFSLSAFLKLSAYPEGSSLSCSQDELDVGKATSPLSSSQLVLE